jgi:hypothetical protein
MAEQQTPPLNAPRFRVGDLVRHEAHTSPGSSLLRVRSIVTRDDGVEIMRAQNASAWATAPTDSDAWALIEVAK